MSEVAIQTTAERWEPAVLQRRKALLQRLGMGAATAMIFSPLFGWEVSAAWIVCYFAVQLLDLVIFAPMNAGEPERMGPLRTFAGGLVLFLNAASFGSLSIALWLFGGPMGGVCAAIVLASGAIYGVVNSPRSAEVLVITIAPHCIYMAMMPFFMIANGAEPAFVTAVAISVVVFIAYCISTWRSMNEAYEAESRARIDAERRGLEAERAMASRSAFLAAIGHDLRTPIGAILTGAAEMDRIAGDASSRANAALITDASLMMKGLLDNLLDHSKLDAGRMTVEVADFNLRVMLAQTLRLWAGPVRAKGLSLRVEGASEMPAMVRGDAMRLRQVLNNLVSNALKFTDTGSVTLRLKSWVEEPSGHAILIEVQDTGPGMTAAQLLRLFTPFDQTAEGISARHGGTGLGLAISRDLVGLMGGRLTARSLPGRGACFTLSLTLAPAINPEAVVKVLDADSRADVARVLRPAEVARAERKPAPVAEPAAPIITSEPGSASEALLASLLSGMSEPVVVAPPVEAAPAPVGAASAEAASVEAPVEDTVFPVDAAAEGEDEQDRPLRVLVVDDHDINRRAVELILAPLGCDISTAADGMAALRQCEAAAFDVIFMDVRMPELDGRETTRRLRAGESPNAKTPVIAVTADTAPDDIAACMAAGMDYFVSKPLTPPALLGALQQVLSTTEEAQTVAA
ncbi:ATP-binding protein [Brevundimonas goettingensis]|uniref:ATP-binding protein n=1 Tax=Brevundimonas goettingensis TaxID=2774190 RepID=UPI001CECD096|nr:ATP-binding protein [Brevundimonas goettingensis]